MLFKRDYSIKTFKNPSFLFLADTVFSLCVKFVDPLKDREGPQGFVSVSQSKNGLLILNPDIFISNLARICRFRGRLGNLSHSVRLHHEPRSVP